MALALAEVLVLFALDLFALALLSLPLFALALLLAASWPSTSGLALPCSWKHPNSHHWQLAEPETASRHHRGCLDGVVQDTTYGKTGCKYVAYNIEKIAIKLDETLTI